jgi:membrane-bound serine protease (ClpP class)
MNKRLTTTRLILAIISNALQLVIIWIIWRWLLPEFEIRLSVPVLISIMAAWAIIGTSIFVFTTGALKKQVQAGQPSMIGTTGKVTSKLAPQGMVKIRGELWTARSITGEIDSGEQIMVTGQEGLKLLVRKEDRGDIKR